MRSAFATITALLALGGCDSKPDNSYTLYRNSPLGLSDRVHFATFNANESAEFNGGNCGMTARLLNANFVASAKADGKEPMAGAGFWCEKGKYAEMGRIPPTFEIAFPATSNSHLSW